MKIELLSKVKEHIVFKNNKWLLSCQQYGNVDSIASKLNKMQKKNRIQIGIGDVKKLRSNK